MSLMPNWRETQRDRVILLKGEMERRGIAEGRPWIDRVELLAEALLAELKAKRDPSPAVQNSSVEKISQR